MPTILYPDVGAMTNLGLIKTHMVSCKCKLYTNSVVLSRNTLKTDLTEATFDGYVAATIAALLAVYINPAGGAICQVPKTQFDYGPAGSPPVTEIVYGWWLEDAAGNLIIVGDFDTPIPMAEVGNSVVVDVALTFGN
jgi:hypothetical protein